MKILQKFTNYFKIFSDRKLWLFMGSGLIVSVAYMDPGNWGTDIAGGASFNYDLLWVVWLASGMAMLFQYLSGKLGIAGYSLPELVKEKLKKKWMVLSYWIFAEIVILATDLAEFLGIVVALNLLFGIPLLWGTYIAVADVLLIILLTQKRFRTLEQSFIIFVSIIGLGFVYELFITKPDLPLIFAHSVRPILTKESALIAVGIIGATVMPHALFVHSWLIKNKIINANFGSKFKTLKYHLIDNVVSLTIAGFINAAIIIMSAAAFYKSGINVGTLDQAYRTLIPLFGNFAALVFALALLSAGISSSVTGTLAGQSVMDGLTGFRIKLWVRRLITRFINVIPVTIAILLGIEPLKILVFSQVGLSLLIPLPLIPLIIYTADKSIMKELVNKKITNVFAVIFALVILGFNAYLLYQVFFQDTGI
ncbi:Nramp family divalent metal transporter [Candidatus Woesearchaeota archaeon]|nr:Nramp family divalent metal transporter [Candidatus Woesearchaeota archaeon]